LSSFFFSSRRRHTRSKRDWSSDVCSSDLRRVSTDVAPPIPARWDNGGGYPCDRCPRPVHHEESTNDRCQHRSDRCPPCPVHPPRSEERRVGKECRCQWATSH